MSTPRYTLISVARTLQPSPTVSLNERSIALMQQGRRVYRFGLGQSPFPIPQSIVQALRENAHQKDYLPVAGLPALRRAVAAYLCRKEGLSIAAKQILVAPGSKELLFLLQLVLDAALLLPSPSWVSYAPQADIHGRTVVPVFTSFKNRWNITPEHLSQACTQTRSSCKMLLLNSPNNPTGLTYSEAELRALADCARDNGLIVLSDEIYSDVHFEGGHQSIARFYPEGTIVTNGISKWCGAGGWRLGVAAFPQSMAEVQETVRTVASESYTSASAPVQYAAVQAFKGGPEIENYIELSQAVLKSIATHTYNVLREAGARVHNPQGGFYVFPDFDQKRTSLKARGIFTSAQLCQRALEDIGTAFLPGTCFGRPITELTARLALVDFDGAHALKLAAQYRDKGKKLDHTFASAAAPTLVEGLDRLAGWL